MRILVVVGMVVGMLAWSQPVSADEGLSGKIWGAIGTPVKVVVTVTHEALHLVQDIAGGVMTVTHSALDVLGIPWENGDE